MPGRYLLDTNIAIGIIEGTIELPDGDREGEEFFLCSTVVGELAYGAEKSGRPEQNLERIRRLLGICPPLAQTLGTAWEYGRLKTRLRRRGKPIPENDVWIAATALQYRATLVSRDRHFLEVDELTLESW